MTVEEVCRRVGQVPQRLLEYNVVANAISRFIRSYPKDPIFGYPHFNEITPENLVLPAKASRKQIVKQKYSPPKCGHILEE
ncbi:hypothetical protein BaRGS_00031421, partial [Batillaria attramentaria]